MFRNKPRIGQELLDVPMGDMIREMAFAIAEAQMKLDANSIDVAEMMGGLKTIEDEDGDVTFEDSRVFFGTEKILPVDAIALHNSTTDLSLKSQIRTKLGTSSYKPVEESHTDPSTPTSVTADKYKIFNGLYYLKDGTSGVKSIAPSEFQVEAVGTLPTTEISIPQRLSMMELGFTPTFYQFVDTIIEVKIAIKYTQEASSTVAVNTTSKNTSTNLKFGFRKAKLGRNISTTQVNASYSQKYSYSAEGSSLLRTKLVPIPPPAVLEDRIRKMMEDQFSDD